MEQLPWQSVEKLMSQYRLPLCKTVFLKLNRDTAINAQSAAKKLGFPLYVKAYSRTPVHKQDSGLVQELVSVEQLAKAIPAMLRNAAKRAIAVDGFLLQPKISGYEFIVGMKRDSVFGPVVLFGLGGVFVEAIHDIALRVAPLTRQDALAMMGETHASKVLVQKKLNADALADILVRLSQLGMNTSLAEVDFNPVIVDTKKATIVDVRFLQ